MPRHRIVKADSALWSILQSAGHALRLRGQLSNDPSARILHYLLLGFASSLIIEVAAAPFWPRKSLASSLVILLILSAITALLLLQRGHFKAASWVYLSATWVISTVIIILGGGARSQDTVFYIALSISAAWLVGYRTALLIGGICVGSLLILAILEVGGLAMPHVFTGEPIPNWVNFVVAMVIATAPVGFFLQTLKNALSRSQEAEFALQEHQEHLEELVQHRTAELVKARDQAREASEQATAANRAKSIFLANMSHELRTPLNAILGFSAIVRTDANLSDKHRKDLEVVAKSGEHLLALIDDVLDMARIETGGVIVDSIPVDLYALVTDAVNMIREPARMKNLDLILDVSAKTPPFVRSDPGKLRQVLVNLVGNAVKYTNEGRVIVRVDANLCDSSSHRVLIFDVEDTGIGISSQDQARIFDPFVQAGTTRTGKGVGLGLAISRRFLEILGGTVEVKSALGRGSLFHVELPVETSELSAVRTEFVVAEEVAALEPGQPDYRILIVEDQKENWLLLERLLQTAGFQTRWAEDGAQAVEAFRVWRPHLIWMDLRLPVLGGVEAAKRIREFEGGQGVKIVAITASASASEREEVLAAGLDDFLRKPYRTREIFDCMARHLGLRYVYRAVLQSEEGDKSTILRPEDLARLPLEQRKQLERTIKSLDPKQIALMIEQVSERDRRLGIALKYLADQFKYTPILQALEACDGTCTEVQHPRRA